MSRSGDWPQIVRCKGGWIGLCIFTPQQWDDFANMIGRPELAGDDRFNSMGGRGRNRELAQSVIRPWLEEQTADEIFELGGLFRVPVAYVGNGRDVLGMDHFRERGVFVENAGGFLQPRSPYRVQTASAIGPRPALPAAARPLDGLTVLDFTASGGSRGHAPPRHPRRRRGEGESLTDPTACASPPRFRRRTRRSSTARPSTAPTGEGPWRSIFRHAAGRDLVPGLPSRPTSSSRTHAPRCPTGLDTRPLARAVPI
jgi:hypothetical protein